MTDAHRTTEGLSPCPHCGATKDGGVVKLYRHVGGDYHGYLSGICDFACGGCGAQGPIRQSKDEAIAAWNRRPPPEPRGEPAEVYQLLANALSSSEGWSAKDEARAKELVDAHFAGRSPDPAHTLERISQNYTPERISPEPSTVQDFVRADNATRERIGDGIARRAFKRQSSEPSAKLVRLIDAYSQAAFDWGIVRDWKPHEANQEEYRVAHAKARAELMSALAATALEPPDEYRQVAAIVCDRIDIVAAAVELAPHHAQEHMRRLKLFKDGVVNDPVKRADLYEAGCALFSMVAGSSTTKGAGHGD